MCGKAVEGLGTLLWNSILVHDFLPKRISFVFFVVNYSFNYEKVFSADTFNRN